MNLKQIIKEEIQKALEETSTMGGGAVEGGPTKPAFGSATKKMREKPQKFKRSPLMEATLTEQQLNEITASEVGNMLRRAYRELPLNIIQFATLNVQKILNAIREFLKVRVEISKKPTNVRKKTIRDFILKYGKYGMIIVGIALVCLIIKAGIVVAIPAFIFSMITGKIDINAAVDQIDKSFGDPASAIMSATELAHNVASDIAEDKKLKIKTRISETGSSPRYPVAHTAGLGRAGTGATGLEDEEEAIVEYLTEAEASAKKPRLGKVTRNPSGSKKKFHVYVKCGGRVKKISFGDPNLSIKRDSPERRKSFRARHKCDKPEGKNRCTARYWSCYQWRAGARVKSEE